MGFIRRPRRTLARSIALALALAGLVALAVVIVPGGTSGPIQAAQPDPAPQVPDSRGLRGDPMLEGRALGSDGTPVADAWLLVLAWPNSDTINALPLGAEVPVEVVGKTKTDRNGDFRLRPPALASLRRFADQFGNVNFELRSVGTAESLSLSFDRHLVDVPGGAVLARPDESNESVREKKVAAGSVSRQTVELKAPPGFDKAVTRSATPTVTKADPSVPECGYPTRVTTYAPQWDVVGQLYATATSGFSGTFTFATGATSSLGVGASFTGAYGSFSANGTASQSSTLTTVFPPLTGAGGRLYRSMFIYSLFKWHCAGYKYPGDGTMYWAVWDEYRAKPTAYAGGASSVAATPPAAPYCVPHDARTWAHIDTSSAVRWTSGMSMAVPIGINLSTQTGYSSTAKIDIYFSASRHLCGTKTVPGIAPGQVSVAP